MKRVLTALVGIPILIYVIKFAYAIVFVTVAYVATLLALYEYFTLTRWHVSARVSWTAYVLATGALAAFYFDSALLWKLLPAGAMLVLLVSFFTKMEIAGALQATAMTLFGA